MHFGLILSHSAVCATFVCSPVHSHHLGPETFLPSTTGCSRERRPECQNVKPRLQEVFLIRALAAAVHPLCEAHLWRVTACSTAHYRSSWKCPSPRAQDGTACRFKLQLIKLSWKSMIAQRTRSVYAESGCGWAATTYRRHQTT